MNVSSEYYTQAQAAQALGVNTRTLRRYVERGLLTRTHVGRSAVYHIPEVERFKSSHTRRGNLAVVDARIATLTSTLRSLEARVRILELALSARGPSVDVTREDAKELRVSAKALLEGAPDYATVEKWARSLPRLTRKACAAVGYRVLLRATAHLIKAGEESGVALREPERAHALDALRVFDATLRGYRA